MKTSEDAEPNPCKKSNKFKMQFRDNSESQLRTFVITLSATYCLYSNRVTGTGPGFQL